MLGLFNLNAMVDVLLWFIPGVFFSKKINIIGFYMAGLSCVSKGLVNYCNWIILSYSH